MINKLICRFLLLSLHISGNSLNFDNTISIPIRELTCILNGNELDSKNSALFFVRNHYTFIHYIDERECSLCQLKTFYQWDDIIDEIDRNDMDYLFIVRPKEGINLSMIQNALKENYFSKPVFIDFDGAYFKNNPKLYSKKKGASHTIVLNADNKIVFEGNPYQDATVLKIIKSL